MNEEPNYKFTWENSTQQGIQGEPRPNSYTFEDALRSISSQLASGGYNSESYTPEDLEARIMAGIDGLTSPLMTRIKEKDKHIKDLTDSHARLVKALEGFANSEGETEYGCTYCGDRRHDAHRCTSGGSHDFEPIGTIHHFAHDEILAAREAVALSKALTGETK